jgi:hypothetical protein
MAKQAVENYTIQKISDLTEHSLVGLFFTHYTTTNGIAESTYFYGQVMRKLQDNLYLIRIIQCGNSMNGEQLIQNIEHLSQYIFFETSDQAKCAFAKLGNKNNKSQYMSADCDGDIVAVL